MKSGRSRSQQVTSNPPMPPKFNRRRAVFVLGKIDEILAWEQRKETDRDTKFVELGRYLCEVRAGQYWRLEKLKSFDDFLERRFPGSRRKAYYLMSIHEHLPPRRENSSRKWGGRRESSWQNWLGGIGSTSIVQPGCTKRVNCQRRNSNRKSRGNLLDGKLSRGKSSTSNCTRARCWLLSARLKLRP